MEGKPRRIWRCGDVAKSGWLRSLRRGLDRPSQRTTPDDRPGDNRGRLDGGVWVGVRIGSYRRTVAPSAPCGAELGLDREVTGGHGPLAIGVRSNTRTA